MTDKQVRMVPYLLPCPFCGGKAKVVSTGVAMKAVRCDSCYAEGPYFCSAMWRDINVSINKAAQAWNRRAAAPSVQPDGWQDISTAPKDGTLILCLYPHRHGHDRYSLRYWSTGDWPSSGRSEGWCDQHRQLRRDDPTHWAPLLAALTVQKEEG